LVRLHGICSDLVVEIMDNLSQMYLQRSSLWCTSNDLNSYQGSIDKSSSSLQFDQDYR
jgi:hypothetical protein